MDFEPLTVKSHPRLGPTKHNAESRRWRQYKHPVFVKEYAPVTSIHFNPSKPHRYAVTAATRVQIYAPRTQKVTKTISRFKDVARNASFRADGKLLVVGDDSGLVQVFDVNSRAILRTLDSHKQPAHVSRFSPLDATQALTCSDDTTVKLWDVSSQAVLNTFTEHTDYPDDTHIAAGMSDGTLSVRRRQPKPSESADNPLGLKANLASGAYEAFLDAGAMSIGEGVVKSKGKAKALGDEDEFRVESRRTKRLKEYDRLLKSFQYSAALDSVLRKQVPPTTTFSLIHELIVRDGLRSALSGRDDVLLEPILRFLIKYVTDPRFGDTVCDVATFIIDMYSPVLGQSPLMDSLFLRLQKKVAAELRLQRTLTKTKGALDMLFATTALAASANASLSPPQQK
ncbi:hypothetical protein ONZ45_g7476 [Pleurotus djamor]|nr:hypothetical protein ONZ45_g7476 [Pleurotus djamor]